MTITLFGGSGNTGRFLIKELLSRGHHLRLLVRNPNSPTTHSTNSAVTIIVGDAEDQNAVTKAISGSDVVVSTLGHKNSSPNMQTIAVKNIMSAMHDQKITRLIVLTGVGVPFPGDHPKFIDILTTKLLKTIDPNRMNDGIAMSELIKKSDLNWTIIRTPLQINRINNQGYKTGLVGDPHLTWHTSRNQIASCIADCIDQKLFINQSPVVTD